MVIDYKSLGESIKARRKELGITQKELARQLNISQGYIADLENGKITNPTTNRINAILDKLGMDSKKLYYVISQDIERVELVNNNSFINVPVVGVVRAGQPIFAEENIIGYFPVDLSLISKDAQYFYLKVTGDSMNKEFPEGSLVLIQKQDYIDNGQIGVILINGYEATIKRVFIKDNIINLLPESTNPIHKLQTYDMRHDEIKILGKVVLAIKKY